jgi:hypothetical protein
LFVEQGAPYNTDEPALQAARGARAYRPRSAVGYAGGMTLFVGVPLDGGARGPLLRRIVILGLLGASFGTLLDYGHVWTGTTVYARPSAFGVAWWVPLLYIGAALGIGLSHPLVDRLLGRRARPPLTPLRLAAGFVGLCAVWFGSGALPLSTGGVSAILGPVVLALWFFLDRTGQGLALALATALSGFAVEVTLSRAGLFHHTHQDVLGVPIWLPWIYVAASVGIGNIGRYLAVDEGPSS